MRIPHNQKLGYAWLIMIPQAYFDNWFVDDQQ